MSNILSFFLLFLVSQETLSVPRKSPKSFPSNHLRVAVSGKKDSDPSLSKRHSFRSEGDFHSVYEKGQVLPGGGVKNQHYFISEDYTVFDGPRERLVPFFDPEKWMNCDCDQPFPPELDIPHRFAVYNPVTVQAPLPDVPKDLISIKYTGHYYACPAHVNPYEFAWYHNRHDVNPCKWIWYQSVEDSHGNIRHK
ncbi:unnamed protein product [Orchesella dallaii]|uniref:Uncharacterized protein n=1 Tax=Orchesella dallaii TaxID=48710 RepID=A0ABP1PLA1_9HEXA